MGRIDGMKTTLGEVIKEISKRRNNEINGVKQIGRVFDIGIVENPEEFRDIIQTLEEQKMIENGDIVFASHNEYGWKISNLSPEVILLV